MALVVIVGANFANLAHAQSVTQGYGATETLQRGMIVSLKEKEPTNVVAGKRELMDKMLGVVVNANDSPITLSNETEKVFVATVGRYDTLVSDQNGAIRQNDYISISHISGIGMKAGLNETSVLGRALASFDGKTNVESTSELSDSKGGKQIVHIGRVPVDIAISKNPIAISNSVSPQILSKIGQAIAGKDVTPVKIYMSAAVFIGGTIIAGSVLYAGVRSSITAVGRNPLSKKSILRGMVSVVFTSLIIFIIALGAVYLLLKL